MKNAIFILSILLSTIIYSQDYEFGEVSKEELEEKFYPLDSTADAAYLYKHRRSYFDYVQNKGFQLVTEIHQRIKIYTKEGFDYATKKIPYYDPERGDSERISKIKGYTFYLDNGKVAKEKLDKSGIFKEKTTRSFSTYKITMPKIKEGCVVEFKYTVFSPYATSIDDVEFQKGIPIKKLDSHIEYPEYYTFNKRFKGFFNVPMKEGFRANHIGELRFSSKTLAFEAENIPALKDDEAYVSNINNYRGGIKFELASVNFMAIGGRFKTFTNSWEKISKEIYSSPAFGGELHKKRVL